MNEFPKVLVPFIPGEGMKIHHAAKFASVGASTMRSWCALYGLGRRIGRPWTVSRVALQMHLDADTKALKAYHSGDRTSEIVVAYYRRLGLDHLLVEKSFRDIFSANNADSARSGIGGCTNRATFR
jgi:hypothetical protein